MANIKLDLSKVKHIKSDERSTTLRHEQGHTIHLLHSALSPENRTQLQALSKIAPQASQAVDKNMAMGGDVVRKAGAEFKKATGATYGADPETQAKLTGNSADVRTPEQKSNAEHYYDVPNTPTQPQSTIDDEGYHKMAKGGKVKEDFANYGNMPQELNRKTAEMLQQKKITKDQHDSIVKENNKNKPKLARGGEVDELSGTGSPANPTSRIDQGFGKVIVRAKGGEVCEACGGKIHMAEGGDPVDKLVPDYKDPATAENQPQQHAMPEPQKDDKAAQLDAYKHNLADIPRGFKSATPDNSASAHLPGPNGEAPIAGYDVKAWQNAQNDVANAKEDNAAQIAGAQQQAIQQNAIRASMGQEPLPVPNVPNGPQIPGSEENPPANNPNPLDPSGQKAVTAAATQTDPNDPYSMLQRGHRQGLQAADIISKAQQEQAQTNAQTLATAQQAKATALANYQDQYQELDNERQAHLQDIRDGYIDPNRYWTGDKDGNGSHSKLAAGIGMILAGFNPTNKPNAAIEFLKYNMDKNMQAQVANLGAKENMLSANLRQFGNMKDATAMTQLMQSDMIQNELAQAAAKAATPMAQAAALNAKSIFNKEDAPRFQEFAMRRAIMNMSSNGGDPNAIDHMLGYMRAVNPAMAKEMESRYVPGVGMGKVEVPQAVREQLVAGQTLQNTAQDVLNYSQKHTNLLPGTPEYNTGVQKSAILQQRIREGMLGTVFRESEKPLLQQFVDDNPAGAFKKLSTQPKLRTILESNAMQMNTLKNSYGLPGNNTPVQMEGQTIINKSTGQRMQMVNGKWTSIK